MLEASDVVEELIGRGATFYSGWDLRKQGVEAVCKGLDHAYNGTRAIYGHFDMDVLGGAGPAPGDILGELAEPIGMTDYECIRIAHELGLRESTDFPLSVFPWISRDVQGHRIRHHVLAGWSDPESSQQTGQSWLTDGSPILSGHC